MADAVGLEWDGKRARVEAELNEEPWGTASGRSSAHRAQREGLTFREGTLEEFVPLYLATQKHLGSPALPPGLFGDWASGFGSKAAVLAVAGKEGRALSAGFYLEHGKTLYLACLGWDRRAAKLCPNDLLFQESLRWAQNRGLESVDWGRSGLGTGALVFKAKWGQVRPMATLFLGGEDPGVMPSRFPYPMARIIYRLLPSGLDAMLSPRLSRFYC